MEINLNSIHNKYFRNILMDIAKDKLIGDCIYATEEELIEIQTKATKELLTMREGYTEFCDLIKKGITKPEEQKISPELFKNIDISQIDLTKASQIDLTTIDNPLFKMQNTDLKETLHEAAQEMSKVDLSQINLDKMIERAKELEIDEIVNISKSPNRNFYLNAIVESTLNFKSQVAKDTSVIISDTNGNCFTIKYSSDKTGIYKAEIKQGVFIDLKERTPVNPEYEFGKKFYLANSSMIALSDDFMKAPKDNIEEITSLFEKAKLSETNMDGIKGFIDFIKNNETTR